MANYLTGYWGKARPDRDDGPSWHPLAYHNLDVAAAGAALLEARPQLSRPLVHATGLPEDVVRNWLLFALALHDVGKFADCFQIKSEAHWRHRDKWSPGRLKVDLGHGGFGWTLWEEWGDPDEDTLSPLFGAGGESAMKAFSSWMHAVAGHHGHPVTNIGGNLAERICPEAMADARAYVADCAARFDVSVPGEISKLKEPAFMRTSWLVAGIAMTSDWIGSNETWFPYEAPEPGLSAYWDRAREKARKALSEAGLAAPRIASQYTLANALPKVDGPQATPLQDWAASAAPIAGQSLVVIEDLTGAGKTEAGLLLAHRLMTAGAAEGLYWALPTMATADALYHRLAASYGAMFADARDASLALAHGARDYNEVFQKSIRLGGAAPVNAYGDAEDEADITASTVCARWIADDRRKTFLADVGVGTIDQALLGVLPSKHQAMRLAGLARRVLVIDEAHAFDSYMTKLIEGLLRFQAALGGSAIVMSATLTKAAREKFARAFADGAGWAKPSIEKSEFPLATAISAGGASEHPLKPSRGTRRDLAVKRLDDDNAAIEVLAAAHAQGQGAVWMRNTVQDAMDAYAAIRARLPDASVDLFHARFALGDRLAIEQRVLASFGKESEGDARRRIVIATQVVEQSLDCDWDVMISDLAPIDLLIQRAGRLHRHHRGARPDPVLHIAAPDPAPDAGPDWYKAAFPRGQYVYKHHGQLWLTMRALIDAGGLKLLSANPRDLIERVFAHESEEIPEALRAASMKAEGAAMSARAVGDLNTLDLGKGYVPQGGAWESDTRTPTRLGDPQRVLRLATWDGATLRPWAEAKDTGDTAKDVRRAWRLSEVSVLATRVADVAIADPALKRAMAREIASWPESYDPPLLVPLVEADGAWEAAAISKDRSGDASPIKLLYCERQGLRFQA